MPGTGLAITGIGAMSEAMLRRESHSPEKAELLVREGRKATGLVESIEPSTPMSDRLVAESGI